MSTDSHFQGWVGHDPSSADGHMKWEPFEPKAFADTDVDLTITHCGVCGSDLHTLRSGWGPTDYPVVVGHEIVGRVARVGAAVRGLTVGDRVGVGAQSDACLRGECKPCATGREQYCRAGMVTTYNARHGSGEKAYGGYATRWRGPARFVFRIPEGLASEAAAPMLCGGVTVYSPLVDNGAGPGMRVGVVGIGGLGHFAVLFAKALRADRVVAISRSASKKEEALKLGADAFIATGEEEGWATAHAESLDLIISTVSGPGMPLDQYLSLLDVNGTFVQVGAPEDPIPSFGAFPLLMKGLSIKGSGIGSRKTAIEMLEFAAKEKVQPWVEVRPMAEANQVMQDLAAGKPRFRYVLKN